MICGTCCGLKQAVGSYKIAANCSLKKVSFVHDCVQKVPELTQVKKEHTDVLLHIRELLSTLTKTVQLDKSNLAFTTVLRNFNSSISHFAVKTCTKQLC